MKSHILDSTSLEESAEASTRMSWNLVASRAASQGFQERHEFARQGSGESTLPSALGVGKGDSAAFEVH